jgi:hypothetical protein
MVMVWQHGGHSNAFTAAEHTNFHFDVSADYLDEALARYVKERPFKSLCSFIVCFFKSL